MKNITLNQLSFTTRDEYLQWRAEWRQQYAQTVAGIRAAKVGIKENNRKLPKDGMDSMPIYVGDFYDKYIAPYHELARLRSIAQELLELRAKSKVKSAEQRAKELA